MKITIITLFPQMFEGFLNESIIKRAQEKGAVQIELVQLRDFAVDDHGTVDERPYGGGAGMVLMAEPVIRALDQHAASGAHVVLTSPRGTVYNQEKAIELSQKEEIVIIAGHYEAVDERVMGRVDEELSMGDYVLTGGELPAATIVDSIVRLVPGVLKKEEATVIESFYEVSLHDLIKAVGEDETLAILIQTGAKTVKLLEYPHYTRPQEFDGQHVPEILLSGNHAEISRWQLQQAYSITKKRRPDLLI
jgi:tRNA (guanine37-N1)-methyltransferase